MSQPQVEIQGNLQPDGTLVLDEKPNLPPGRVRVTVRSEAQTRVDEFMQMLQGIWAAREAAGLVPRSTEEVEAERRTLREEMDQEIEEAGRLQEESRRLREAAAQKREGPQS